MPIKLATDQRSFLLDIRRHPRSLRQYYAARSLLALDSGLAPGNVAARLGLPVSLVKWWSLNYQQYGADYIVSLGHPVRSRRVRGSKARIVRVMAEATRSTLAEQMRRIQAKTPKMADLVRMARSPSAEGADLEADPAELFRAE